MVFQKGDKVKLKQWYLDLLKNEVYIITGKPNVLPLGVVLAKNINSKSLLSKRFDVTSIELINQEV